MAQSPQKHFLIQYDENYELDVCDQVLDELAAILSESSIRFEDHGIGPYEYMGARGVHASIAPMIDLAFHGIAIELPESDKPYNLGDTFSVKRRVNDYNGDEAGEVILMAERSEKSTESRTVYHLYQG